MLIVIGAVLLLALVSYFAVQNHLDRKAARLQQGSEEERQSARELRELSRKIDQGKYLYR
ncbi:hypothetical protein FYJ32_04025 [Bifidobacterium tsurumiense]|nr:hypothetical protein [Bifidobacterium tsurumiense]